MTYKTTIPILLTLKAKLEKEKLVLFTEAGSITIKAIEDIHYTFATGK
ncbi:MAG: hypothetical protein ACYDGO_13480 [Smithellaceae bacterium]